jgi:serine/threonine protein kinase
MEWSNLIGRSLDNDGEYEIIAEIGRGGSSPIYRAWDRVGEREVAVKVIPNDADDREGFVRRFEREVQAFAQLHHPNIVEVYGNGETDELVYLVMQYIAGGTLHARLGRPLPIPEAAEAIIQMAQALHHAHQRGVIHRDVMPANMLVDEVNPASCY